MLITVRCPLRTRVRRGHGVMRDSSKGHALVASVSKDRRSKTASTVWFEVRREGEVEGKAQ